MPPISPLQVRAARAMLDWSMADLARTAKISISTVKRFEDGRSVLVSDGTVGLLQDALERQGVRFLPDDGNGLGVRCRGRGASPRTD